MAKPLKLLDAKEGRPRLDRYELIAALASGGMATVYLGRVAGAGGFQRYVAIKQLHPHLAHEAEFVGMFLDEGRLAAGIHHPNVVPILDIGTSEAGYYLVMEYIEGDTLATLRTAAKNVDHAGLTHKIALRIVLDSLRGLHAAHELRDEGTRELLGLVHRDVSPQNILVGVDGTTRITDFGVARAASRLTSSRAGELKGKIAYMAPEQVLGEDLDRRADIFAMGIVIWEMLSNRHLFRSDSDAATMRQVLEGPIPDLTTAAPGIPAPVAKIVAWALSRPRDSRPSTCAELADALERAAVRTLGVATPAEVAAYVDHLVGPTLVERRSVVREWLAKTSSGASQSLQALSSGDVSALLTPITGRSRPDMPGSSSGSSSIVRVDTAVPPPPTSRALQVVTLVAFAIALFGGIALLLLRQKPPPPPATTSAPLLVVVSAPPPPSAQVPPVAVVAPIPTASEAPAALPSAAASTAAVLSAAPVVPGVVVPGTARGRATATTPTAAPRGGDDDMSKNPYR